MVSTRNEKSRAKPLTAARRTKLNMAAFKEAGGARPVLRVRPYWGRRLTKLQRETGLNFGEMLAAFAATRRRYRFTIARVLEAYDKLPPSPSGVALGTTVVERIAAYDSWLRAKGGVVCTARLGPETVAQLEPYWKALGVKRKGRLLECFAYLASADGVLSEAVVAGAPPKRRATPGLPPPKVTKRISVTPPHSPVSAKRRGRNSAAPTKATKVARAATPAATSKSKKRP